MVVILVIVMVVMNDGWEMMGKLIVVNGFQVVGKFFGLGIKVIIFQNFDIKYIQNFFRLINL